MHIQVQSSVTGPYVLLAYESKIQNFVKSARLHALNNRLKTKRLTQKTSATFQITALNATSPLWMHSKVTAAIPQHPPAPPSGLLPLRPLCGAPRGGRGRGWRRPGAGSRRGTPGWPPRPSLPQAEPGPRCPPTCAQRHLPSRHTLCQGGAGGGGNNNNPSSSLFYRPPENLLLAPFCLSVRRDHRGASTAAPAALSAPRSRGGGAGASPDNAPPGPDPAPAASGHLARRCPAPGLAVRLHRLWRTGSPPIRFPPPPAAARAPAPPRGRERPRRSPARRQVPAPLARRGRAAAIAETPTPLSPPLTAAHGGARSFVCPPRPGTAVPRCRAPRAPSPPRRGRRRTQTRSADDAATGRPYQAAGGRDAGPPPALHGRVRGEVGGGGGVKMATSAAPGGNPQAGPLRSAGLGWARRGGEGTKEAGRRRGRLPLPVSPAVVPPAPPPPPGAAAPPARSSPTAGAGPVVHGMGSPCPGPGEASAPESSEASRAPPELLRCFSWGG